jgi:hypothetical protein
MANCLKFCAASSAGADTAVLSTTFGRQSSLLLQLLTSLGTHLAPAGLAQLLTRIDYNRFFSRRERAAASGPAQ